jgi:acyl carrier protein
LFRIAEDRHRFVLTNHHIVLDGWSKPILLQEIFAGYYGHRLPAPVPYRRFVTWLADQDHGAAQAAWREVFDGFDTPTLVGLGREGLGRRGYESLRVTAETTRALGQLARSCHTTVSTVLQAAWAQLLYSLTGQHDVAFGTAVSGRPAEVAGADSMVGLMINTVPVRAKITAETTIADLLEQLQSAHNHTLEHQHLSLSDMHRITGQERLFDTVFVYENYPTGAASAGTVDELVITEATNRDYYHYPLTIQAAPGRELHLRIQFRTDVFDMATIEGLMARFKRVLVAMTADPTRRLSTSDLRDGSEHAQLDGWGNGEVSELATTVEAAHQLHDTGDDYRAPATLVEQILAGIYAEVLDVDQVSVDESFFELGGDSLSAMRAIAAINTAFDAHLAVTAVFDALSVRSLGQQLADTPPH